MLLYPVSGQVVVFVSRLDSVLLCFRGRSTSRSIIVRPLAPPLPPNNLSYPLTSAMPSFFCLNPLPKRGLARSRLGLPGPRRLFSRNAVLGSISIAESYSQCQASGGRGKDSENSARRPAPRNASRVSRETRRMGVNGVRLGAAPADFLRARRAERIEHLRCAIERWRSGRTAVW